MFIIMQRVARMMDIGQQGWDERGGEAAEMGTTSARAGESIGPLMGIFI